MTSIPHDKLFHVCAAATGNAWSPTVDSRADGTSNAEVDDDVRRRGEQRRRVSYQSVL